MQDPGVNSASSGFDAAGGRGRSGGGGGGEGVEEDAGVNYYDSLRVMKKRKDGRVKTA